MNQNMDDQQIRQASHPITIDWDRPVSRIRQRWYFSLPTHELTLQPDDFQFSAEFLNDLRVCRSLKSQVLRNEYFKYMTQKYGFYHVMGWKLTLGGYVSVVSDLKIKGTMTMSEAIADLQTLYKKHWSRFLAEFKKSNDGSVRGDVVQDLLTDFVMENREYSFSRKFDMINGKAQREKGIGKILKSFRSLGPNLQIIKAGLAGWDGNRKQFIFRFKSPLVKERNKFKDKKRKDTRKKKSGKQILQFWVMYDILGTYTSIAPCESWLLSNTRLHFGTYLLTFNLNVDHSFSYKLTY